MKKRLLIFLISLIVVVSAITALSGCRPSSGDESVEDAVLSYTAEYLPLQEAFMGMDSYDLLVESMEIENPKMTGRIRHNEFERALHQRQYGGLVRERYCFYPDTSIVNRDELICATAEMSFYAPKPYSYDDELHNKVLDEGVIYVREFYERLSGSFLNRGIILDGNSEEIAKDKYFSSAGCNENEEAVVIISFVNDTNLLTESKLASENGSYIYCKIYILIKASGEMPVDKARLWYPMFDEPLKRIDNN